MISGTQSGDELDPDTVKALLALQGLQSQGKQNDRTQAMADAMRKQSFATPQGQTVAGGQLYVAPNPLQALANAGTGYVSNVAQGKADQRATAMDQQRQDAYARYLQSMAGGQRSRGMPGAAPPMQQPMPQAMALGAGANPMADLDPNDPNIRELLRQQMMMQGGD